MPYWPINPELSPSPWFTFQLDFNRAFWTVLPGAMLWGASFPLALAAVGRRGQDPGRLVGSVYAANTLGAILGAVLASLLMIAWLGTQQAQRVMIVIAAISACIMLVPFASDSNSVRFSTRSAVHGLLAIVLAGLSVWSVAKIPNILVAYGRYAVTWMNHPREYLFVGEGRNSSMAVSRQPDGVLNYHNAARCRRRA